MKSKALGQLGEDIAAKWLLQRNHTILARNYRLRTGEIDIISLRNKELIFTEVKTRRSLRFGEPHEAVIDSKIKTIQKTGMQYAFTHGLDALPMRVEVIAIYINSDLTCQKVLHFGII